MRSFLLFELPCDVLGVIIGHLPLKSVYNMKTTSHAASLLVSDELATGPRVNASFGVRNVRLVTRDCHRLVNPAVSGRLTKTAFMLLQKRCDPPMTTLHARLATVSYWLLRSAVIQPQLLGLTSLTLDVTEPMLERLYVLGSGSLTLDSLTVNAKQYISIDMALDALYSKNVQVKHLRLTGFVHSMSYVYSALPMGLKTLGLHATRGDHDVSSIPMYLELELDELHLRDCYEVCSHAECSNYHLIPWNVRRAVAFPRVISMSPMPLDSLKFLWSIGVHVSTSLCAFLEHEHSTVCQLLDQRV